MFFLGSPLSHQLLPLERSFLVLSTLPSLPSAQETSSPVLNIKVPFKFIGIPQASFPYSNGEEIIIKSLTVSRKESLALQENTKKQLDCPEWFEARKSRITSSNAHRIFFTEK